MKTGMMLLGALAVVIAGGAVTTEPRAIHGYEFEFDGDTYVPCLGEYTHDFGSLTGPMVLLQYDYKLTVRPNGELVVQTKIPPIADWTRCVGPSH